MSAMDATQESIRDAGYREGYAARDKEVRRIEALLEKITAALETATEALAAVRRDVAMAIDPYHDRD